MSDSLTYALLNVDVLLAMSFCHLKVSLFSIAKLAIEVIIGYYAHGH